MKKMMTSVVILASALAFQAAAQAPSAAEKELRGIEEQRYKAMIQADLATLQKLLADDLVYVHSSGSVESKEQFLDTVRSGRLRYKRIAPEGTRFKVSGNMAAVTGGSNIDVEREGKPQSFRVRFTAVYEKTGGAWRLVAWQTTRLPES